MILRQRLELQGAHLFIDTYQCWTVTMISSKGVRHTDTITCVYRVCVFRFDGYDSVKEHEFRCQLQQSSLP